MWWLWLLAFSAWCFWRAAVRRRRRRELLLRAAEPRRCEITINVNLTGGSP